jgi:hypothetical protein
VIRLMRPEQHLQQPNQIRKLFTQWREKRGIGPLNRPNPFEGNSPTLGGKLQLVRPTVRWMNLPLQEPFRFEPRNDRRDGDFIDSRPRRQHLLGNDGLTVRQPNEVSQEHELRVRDPERGQRGPPVLLPKL